MYQRAGFGVWQMYSLCLDVIHLGSAFLQMWRAISYLSLASSIEAKNLLNYICKYLSSSLFFIFFCRVSKFSTFMFIFYVFYSSKVCSSLPSLQFFSFLFVISLFLLLSPLLLVHILLFLGLLLPRQVTGTQHSSNSWQHPFGVIALPSFFSCFCLPVFL